MEELHLSLVIDKLKGPSKEHIVVHNQWAAVGLDRFHENSTAEFEFIIDGQASIKKIVWDSNFSKKTMKEDVDIANHGGVAIAWFVMSIILGYEYVEQTEIGDGVDYRFSKYEPDDDDLNFLANDFHYVEISGIITEKGTNTVNNRIKLKHKQIKRGSKNDEFSSVIVTLLSQAKAIKEIHK